MSQIKVGLVQINNSFSGQYYFPYSVGILQAYAQKHLSGPGRYRFELPIFKRLIVAEAVELLAGVDIAFFSVYCWSEQLSLAIAKILKRKFPSKIVVFGGPQVPRQDRPWEVEIFHNQHRFVDLAVHGAGEIPFTAILEQRLKGGTWEDLPSVSFLNAPESLCQTMPAPELKNLSLVPEPYLSGVFDPLMAEHPQTHWIGIDETNRNCPFQCTFCGWGLLASKPIPRDLKEVYRVIDWFAANRIEYVFYCDANFGIWPRDVEIAEYIADSKRRTGYPKNVSVQDGKNVERRVYEIRKQLLAGGIATPVVIALQSVHPPTLEAIKRKNISYDAYLRNQRQFSREGIKTMTDLILGLPEETYDSFADGVSKVIEWGQHNRIQFNNLAIVPDAELSHRDYVNRYGIETIWTRIVNIHGRIENEEVPERQELVIATSSMPKPDWVKTRAFAWWTALLHFDKLIQIPIVIAHEYGGFEHRGLSYRELFELFSSSKLDPDKFPVLIRIREFFEAKARDIQSGGVEFCHAPHWLDIYWPADEYIMIELATSEQLETFYHEVKMLLCDRVAGVFAADAIPDAIRLNQALLKLPFQKGVVEVECGWNIWETYQAVLFGDSISLTPGKYCYRIDRIQERWGSWEEWCEKVVWWANRSGAYLRGTKAVAPALAGHY